MQGLFEFQGRLSRADKRPANPGSYCLQFQLHGQERDSKRDKVYWEEVLESVDVAAGGFYRVVLGRSQPVDGKVFGRGVRWMSVRVVRSGTLDDENGARSPVIGQDVRLYASIDRIDGKIEDLQGKLSAVISSSPKTERFQTRLNRLSDELSSLNSRMVSIESGVEIAAIVRRVESITDRLASLDKDGGRLDRVEDEVYELIGADGDVVDLNERMDRLEGRAPELIRHLREREKSAPEQLRLDDLRKQIQGTQVQLEDLAEQVSTLSTKDDKSTVDPETLGVVMRSGDAMTGGLTINRGGLNVLSGGLNCKGANVTTLEASNLVKATKMLADSFELRGEFTVDSATRGIQVRTIEGRQASARRDGALHLNVRGGAEVVIGNKASAKGAEVHGSIRAKSVVAQTTGGVAQLFRATSVLTPGDVVRVNDTGERVVRVRKLADPRILGVVTDQPGVLLGGELRTGHVMVAVTGVVVARVDASKHPIKVGDLLIASGTSGHAETGENAVQGTVLGKAMAPLAKGAGMIPVLLGGG
jgi:prefoldin subunit 5